VGGGGALYKVRPPAVWLGMVHSFEDTC